ncbi:putative sensor-like histidine kinase [compost metagenome]
MTFYDKKSSTNTLNPKSRLSSWQRLSKLHGVNPVIIGKQRINGDTSEKKQVFSVLRTVQSAGTLKDIGIIIIDVNLELLDGIVTALQSTTQGQALIADELGEPLYGDQSASLEALNKIRNNPSIYPAGAGHFEFSDSHEVRHLAVYNTSSQTGWTTIVTIPLSLIMEPVKNNTNKLITTSLIIISFALGVATLFSFALTSPLKNLVRLMRRVQHGHLDVWLNPKYNDEIGMLASQFNIMIIRIKGLLQEVAETEQRKRKADIRALQNQINPHFIYNTLESIRMLAEGSDEPRVAELTYLLGSQMRYGIVDSDELVTVHQELEHVQNYVQLLCIRFPDKFKLELHIPEHLLPIPMIKLAFQPIVENAVFHGLDAKQNEGLLTITGWQEKNIAKFSITDNGIGMDETTLNILRKRLQENEQSNKSGIGLRNVNERLRLYYGEECTLQVDSQPHKGTTVTISIPFPDYDITAVKSISE